MVWQKAVLGHGGCPAFCQAPLPPGKGLAYFDRMKRIAANSIRQATMPTSFRLYLQAELVRRCAGNPHYSLRAFAKHLAIDHATLSQFLRCKRRFTPAAIEKLGKRLGIDYHTLSLFIAREQGTQLHQAAATFQEVQQLAHDTANLISDWYHFSILELVQLPHFQPGSRWIARVLGITPDEVNIAVTRLLRLGLLEMKSQSCWVTKSNLVAASINEFARTTIERLQEQVQKLLAMAERVNGHRSKTNTKRQH
jgi:uncharacterized protein (TIGR02147 family)